MKTVSVPLAGLGRPMSEVLVMISGASGILGESGQWVDEWPGKRDARDMGILLEDRGKDSGAPGATTTTYPLGRGMSIIVYLTR